MVNMLITFFSKYTFKKIFRENKMKNLDKYKQDLDNLISSGKILYKAMYYNCNKK